MAELLSPQQLAQQAKQAAAVSRQLVQANPQVAGGSTPVIPTSQGGAAPGGGGA